MEVQSNSGAYIIKGESPKEVHAQQVGYTNIWKLYLCIEISTNRQCLFQVAATKEQNNALSHAAYILKELKVYANELEEEYAHVKPNPDYTLNYDLQFPELVDSFLAQDGRLVNILAFRNVEKVISMVPLGKITAKNLRVDLRTSAWIMGKLLKLLDFVHTQNMSVNLVNGGNILIVPKEHYVLILDWTAVQIHDKGVPAEIQRQEIAQVAQAVIAVLGGDSEKGIFPDDEEEEVFSEYTDYLLQLTRGSESSADMAHEKFYEIVDLRWKGFYPFTVKPLS